jgi:hypothetical protein
VKVLARGRQSFSERFQQTCLLQGVIRPMAGLDLGVYHEAALADRTLPDFVIALALALEPAACLPQQLLTAGV